MDFTGPRPACLALDTVMDQIGNPVVQIINDLSLTDAEKADAKKKFEDVLVEVFAHQDGTIQKLRNYIYDLNRSLNEQH